MLDMHFTVEIARFAGYPSRHLNKISSDIIARAVKAFSARGIDPQRSLFLSLTLAQLCIFDISSTNKIMLPTVPFLRMNGSSRLQKARSTSF